MAIEIVSNITESQKDEAVNIIMAAFKQKFENLIFFTKDEKKIHAFTRSGFISGNGLYAVENDVVLGVVGLKAKNRDYLVYQLSNFVDIFGIFGGLWRCLFHKLFELFETTPKDDEMFIELIAVSKKSQGMGIGTKLFDKVYEEAAKEKKKKISLEVVNTNPKAQMLYERLGFETYKTVNIGKIIAKAGFTSVSYMKKEL